MAEWRRPVPGDVVRGITGQGRPREREDRRPCSSQARKARSGLTPGCRALWAIFRLATAFCSTNRTVVPRPLMRAIKSNNWLTSNGARPSDGSSIISSRGLALSARPIASICCCPPLMVRAGVVRVTSAGCCDASSGWPATRRQCGSLPARPGKRRLAQHGAGRRTGCGDGAGRGCGYGRGSTRSADHAALA